MTKTVITREDLSEMENVRLHNMAMMYLNITEDESHAAGVAYLASELRAYSYDDVKPFIEGAKLERGIA